MSESRRIPTPAPADRPSFTIKVAGAALSGERQLPSITVSRELNRVAWAELLIFDGDPATEDFPVSNTDEFKPGQDIEISAGYHGDEQLIFKGIVVRHGISISQDKPALLRVECRDAAMKMTVGRNSAYFFESSDADIIEELAGAHGLSTAIDATDLTHQQMVQYDASDWDFILNRATANGFVVATEDGELRVFKPDPGSGPVVTLRYGGNLLEFDGLIDAREQFPAVAGSAWDPANQESLLLESADPGSLSSGNIDSAELADVVGLQAFTLRHGGHAKDAELQVLVDGRARQAALAKTRGRGRAQGFADAALGKVVALEGVGERFNGNVLITGIRQEITTKNWETHVAFGLSPEALRPAADSASFPAGGLLPAASGLVVAKVTALEGDPDGEDRIQLSMPMVDVDEQGVWARIAAVDAGDARGFMFRPEIDDEVVVGFFADDPRDPVVLGGLHSSAKPAPITASDDNHEKGIVTRSDMRLLFNDDTIVVSLSTPNGNTISLSEEDGGLSIEDENGNKLTMDANGITLESASDLNIKASGDVTIEGSNVSSTAQAQLKAEGSAGAELSSGGSTTVKGSIVQIN